MTTIDSSELASSSPGRICLFGEHQDYLGLPVIPAAISLRIAIEGRRNNSQIVNLHLPDINSSESFSFDGPLPYLVERDYFRSVVNVMRRNGFTFTSGFDCTVRGNIPINSGTSSSSALIVTWVNFLARMSDQAQELAPERIAVLAHAAEVLEFGEPGGMMDHFSTAIGGTIFLEFEPKIRIAHLRSDLGSFVLGDSGEPKDTKSILARVKDQVVAVSKRLAQSHPGFTLHTASISDLDQLKSELTNQQSKLFIGTIRNRDITFLAREVLTATLIDRQKVGSLLNEHQAVLRDVLRISTPKIDRMIDAALKAGALGGKINGSGGGGCMFAYAPEKAEEVAEAIERVGGKAYVVSIGEGARFDKLLSV